MAKKLSSVLGIDIGSRRIKVCEVRAQGKEPSVTALGVVETPEGAVDHSGIYNPEAVGQAVKAALQQAGAAAPAAVVTIAGQNSVLVRTLEVPKMNDAELKDHMQWEINRNIPFAESTVVSDYKPLGGDDPASPNMDVVMAIAPQSAVDTIVQVFKKTGKNIAAIDVEPLSLARSVGLSYGDEYANRTVCLVDMGAATCSINIYSGTKLLMPRQIPVGGDMFTQSLATEFGVPLGEAEAMKADIVIPEDAAVARTQVVNPFDVPGTPTQEFSPYNPFADDPVPAAPVYSPADPFAMADETPGAPPAYEAADPFAVQDDPYGQPAPVTNAPVPAGPANREFDAVAPLLDDFASEVRRSIDYFRSRGGDVDVILLSGGGAKLQGLAHYLTQILGVPCDAYDPLRRLNVNVRKIAPDFVDQHRQEFAVAVGNGLYIFFD